MLGRLDRREDQKARGATSRLTAGILVVVAATCHGGDARPQQDKDEAAPLINRTESAGAARNLPSSPAVSPSPSDSANRAPTPSSRPVPAPAPSTGTPNNLHPNEPSGFQAFAEMDASVIPPTEKKTPIEHATGVWYSVQPKNPRLTVVDDPDAPVSPPKVLQTKFPKGLEAGRGPVHFGGWDAAGNMEGQKEKFYLSLWLKIVGPDFEIQSSGQKMGFVASALPINKAAATQVFLWLANNGGQRAMRSFSVEARQETGPKPQGGFNRNMKQNANRAQLMTCGQWHQWELVFELNTLGQQNGVLKWWIDGTLVMEHRDVTYVFGDNTNGFWNWKWNPTWGGTKGRRTRDDYMLIDHVYMSGIPYTGRKVLGPPRAWEAP